MVVESRGREMWIKQGRETKQWTTLTDPLKELEQLLGNYRAVSVPGLPRFSGGFVGFGGYDLVRFFEPVGKAKPDVLNLPDSAWMLSDTLVIFDHLEHVMKVVANAVIPPGPASTLSSRAKAAYAKAVRRVEEMTQKLRSPLWRPATAGPRKISPPSVRSNMSREAFLKGVRHAKKEVARGEAIQVVLSQRFQVPVACPPFEIYRALRSLNPSPYMFYLNMGSYSLVGSSPEILVRCEDGVAEVRPIAGTRRRGKTPASDRQIEEGLRQDPKERAEHLMLADLGRNDLGRVCKYGSVKVANLMNVERYSHVMHLVSDVKGKLRKGKSVFDLFRAAFPAGTVTGAPKVRAMQIINELEPDSRGPYAGAVGYFSFDGNLDTCITIRTVLVQGNRATVQAGAGIVADSKPEKEYQETKNKAAGMLEAIRLAEQGLE
jgi:anthranilate synthase component 1